MDSSFTTDAFLGGALSVRQPGRRHHRSGMDAVMLAAAFPDHLSGTVLDFGAGAGAAGMCLAVRREDLQIGLVENNPVMLKAAHETLQMPENQTWADRVEVHDVDLLGSFAAREQAGLKADSVDHVIMNPPYFARGTMREADGEARVAAHVFAADDLEKWMRAAASAIRGTGTLTVVYRMDRLPQLLDAVAGRFGSIRLLPLHPHPAAPAHRLLLHAVKGGRGPFDLLAGRALHQPGQDKFSAWADDINRRGVGLDCFNRR